MTVLAAAPGPTDLSEVLAQPVDTEFADAGGAAFLSGQFDAHKYAVWLAGGGSDVQPFEEWLRSNGFVRGYSRTWSEPVHVEVGVGESRVQYLTETVEEFRGVNGAKARQDSTRPPSETQSGFEKVIQTTIDGAWGAVFDAGYSTEYEVSFRKGNDVYFVMMDSAVNDMTEKVVTQATSQFARAPASTIPPGASQSPGARSFPLATGDHALLIAGEVVIGAVVVITFLVLIALVSANRRWRGSHGVSSQGTLLSPDGAYWWDGTAWQPTSPNATGPH